MLKECLQRQRQKQEEAELMHSQLGCHMQETGVAHRCAAFLACQEAAKKQEKEVGPRDSRRGSCEADLRLAEQWKLISERPEDAQLWGRSCLLDIFEARWDALQDP